MDTHPLLLLAAVALVALVVLRPILFGGPRVSAREAQARIEAGRAVLIDVREPAEWRQGVAAPAALLAMSDFRGARAHWRTFLEKHREQELILYCASGVRSGMLARALAKEGFNVANLGGFSAWTRAGLPVRRP